MNELPKFLWESLAITAAYLHNRSPSRLLGYITPFEKDTGVKPDLSHLRVVGIKALMHIPTEKRRGKLINYSKIIKLVGYINTLSIYLVYDPKARKVVRSRDLVFFKNAGDYKLDEGFDEDDDLISDAPIVPYLSIYREDPLGDAVE